jgi:hypothetical protein
LLDQAQHLALKEPKRPRQASLRRAVSSAYYALFHLLIEEGARALSPSRPPQLRNQVQRAYAHGDMKTVCQQFGKGQIGNLAQATQKLIQSPLQNELATVARTFVALQEERHDADYDISKPFNRIDVVSKIDLVRLAFDDWGRVRTSPNARVFLAALLLQRHWNK